MALQKHFIVAGRARHISEIDAFLYGSSTRTDYAFDGRERTSIKALITVTAENALRLDYLTTVQRDRYASGLFGTSEVTSLAAAKTEIAAYLTRP